MLNRMVSNILNQIDWSAQNETISKRKHQEDLQYNQPKRTVIVTRKSRLGNSNSECVYKIL